MRFRHAILASTLVLQAAAVAMATPIGGNATLGYQNQDPPIGNNCGLSGFFVYNPATDAIDSWTFTSITTNFGTHVYDSANKAVTGATATRLNNSNNDLVLAFGQNFQDRYELDIVNNCFGVGNCVTFGDPNEAFAIRGGVAPCAPGALKCISSGEQLVFGPGLALLKPGFFNLTDPPATVAFNIDSIQAPGSALFTGAAG